MRRDITRRFSIRRILFRLFTRRRERRHARKRAWEAVCARCGLCCYQKTFRGAGVVINMNAPCIHLDTVTKLCRVYDNRFRVCPDCRKVTLYHALFSSLMPEQCGYVRKYRKLKFLVPFPSISQPRHRNF